VRVSSSTSMTFRLGWSY